MSRAVSCNGFKIKRATTAWASSEKLWHSGPFLTALWSDLLNPINLGQPTFWAEGKICISQTVECWISTWLEKCVLSNILGIDNQSLIPFENYELHRGLQYKRERNISNLVSSYIVTQLIQYVDFYHLNNHTTNTNQEHQLFKHFPEDETPLTYKSCKLR